MMCPRCRNGRLHATGAFQVCDTCGLAVTEQALKLESAVAMSNGHGGEGDDGQHTVGRGAWHRVVQIDTTIETGSDRAQEP